MLCSALVYTCSHLPDVFMLNRCQLTYNRKCFVHFSSPKIQNQCNEPPLLLVSIRWCLNADDFTMMAVKHCSSSDVCFILTGIMLNDPFFGGVFYVSLSILA